MKRMTEDWVNPEVYKAISDTPLTAKECRELNESFSPPVRKRKPVNESIRRLRRRIIEGLEASIPDAEKYLVNMVNKEYSAFENKEVSAKEEYGYVCEEIKWQAIKAGKEAEKADYDDDEDKKEYYEGLQKIYEKVYKEVYYGDYGKTGVSGEEIKKIFDSFGFTVDNVMSEACCGKKCGKEKIEEADEETEEDSADSLVTKGNTPDTEEELKEIIKKASNAKALKKESFDEPSEDIENEEPISDDETLEESRGGSNAWDKIMSANPDLADELGESCCSKKKCGEKDLKEEDEDDGLSDPWGKDRVKKGCCDRKVSEYDLVGDNDYEKICKAYPEIKNWGDFKDDMSTLDEFDDLEDEDDESLDESCCKKKINEDNEDDYFDWESEEGEERAWKALNYLTSKANQLTGTDYFGCERAYFDIFCFGGYELGTVNQYAEAMNDTRLSFQELNRRWLKGLIGIYKLFCGVADAHFGGDVDTALDFFGWICEGDEYCPLGENFGWFDSEGSDDSEIIKYISDAPDWWSEFVDDYKEEKGIN